MGVVGLGAHVTICFERGIETCEALRDVSDEDLLGMGFEKAHVEKLRVASAPSSVDGRRRMSKKTRKLLNLAHADDNG